MAPKKDKNFGVQGKEGGLGGKYARKALNLSSSELKKAGASKAAAAREVDVTQTTRAYGTGKTLGPAGKPLTGTVKMGDGTTAVYKNGVRVRKAASGSAPSSSSTGGTNRTPKIEKKPDPKPTSGTTYVPGAKGQAGKSTKAMAAKGAKEKAAMAAKRAAASKTASGTPSGTTAKPKYKTPGPDLGKAYEEWKKKPMISAKDRETSKKKAEFEKKAKAAIVSRIKKGK